MWSKFVRIIKWKKYSGRRRLDPTDSYAYALIDVYGVCTEEARALDDGQALEAPQAEAGDSRANGALRTHQPSEEGEGTAK